MIEKVVAAIVQAAIDTLLKPGNVALIRSAMLAWTSDTLTSAPGPTSNDEEQNRIIEDSGMLDVPLPK